MPRQRQINKKVLTQVSQQFFQELGEEVLKECENILPMDTRISIKDSVTIKATPESIAFEFDSSFDSIFFPSKYTGQSVFKARGINPNTGTPYGYSAETRKHTRTTTRGIVPVRAHTKYYSLGYKPVEGKDGKWYTASPENNFGLRMAQQKIQRNFLQNAWNKVYRKLPKEIRNDLPKAIQIQE